MTVGITNIASLNSLFADVYEKAWLGLRAETVLGQLAMTFTDSKGIEDRVFSEREQATAGHVSEGTDFQSPSRLGKTQIATLTPGEAMSQAKITHRDLRHDPDVRADAGLELAMGMAQLIDEDLITSFASLTGGETGTIGADGVAPTWSYLIAGQTQLQHHKVPGRYSVVLHPYVLHALTKTITLTTDLASLPDAIKDGLRASHYVGSYQNMDFYSSSNIAIESNQTTIGAMFAPGAIALDFREQPHPFPPEFDASAREWELNYYADYGFGVRRPKLGLKLVFETPVPTGA